MSNLDRNTLRQKVLALRDALSAQEMIEKSASVIFRLTALPVLQSAGLVFTYVHFRSEVRTLQLIRLLLSTGKKVAVPSTVREESRLLAVQITDPRQQLEPGYCGIPEPLPHQVQKMVCSPADIDVVLVPGSVFDPSGGRMGYGGGFYDRFLSKEAPRATRIGLAYELQLVERVPLEEHDQCMDFLVTENHLYDCRRKRYAPNSCVSG